MKMPFDSPENHESRDTASPRKQMTRESSNMVVNVCLPEYDASFGIGINRRFTMRYIWLMNLVRRKIRPQHNCSGFDIETDFTLTIQTDCHQLQIASSFWDAAFPHSHRHN
jgi:hypothetical protein